MRKPPPLPPPISPEPPPLHAAAEGSGSQLVQPPLTQVRPASPISVHIGLPRPQGGLLVIHHYAPLAHTQMIQEALNFWEGGQPQVVGISEEVVQPIGA